MRKAVPKDSAAALPVKIGSEGCGNAIPNSPREGLVSKALRLEYLTVAWNLVEGVVAVGAALRAGSIALIAFGIDSFVEVASAGILIWRLKAEQRLRQGESIERVDRTAHRLVGASLFGLAAFIVLDAGWTLWKQEKPHPSLVGLAVTGLSLGVMFALARAKRSTAAALGSRALEADSFQTSACWWLSLATLAGVGLNTLFGWWWADPVAALGMSYFLVLEGREAWAGDECC
ncbi:MAG: cation transporter [Acidobacteriota bacterium]